MTSPPGQVGRVLPPIHKNFTENPMAMTSYDEHGPLIPRGPVSFSTRLDNIPGGKHTFEVPVFMVAEEESQVIVEYNGFRLCDFGEHSDYYGFGTSPRDALQDADASLKKIAGLNADVYVLTKIKMTACIISDEKPFYARAQRVNRIPYSWCHEREDIKHTIEEFIVWKNGAPTEEAGTYYDRIKELSLADAAPSRMGDLRTIIAGENARTRDNFLLFGEDAKILAATK